MWSLFLPSLVSIIFLVLGHVLLAPLPVRSFVHLLTLFLFAHFPIKTCLHFLVRHPKLSFSICRKCGFISLEWVKSFADQHALVRFQSVQTLAHLFDAPLVFSNIFGSVPGRLIAIVSKDFQSIPFMSVLFLVYCDCGKSGHTRTWRGIGRIFCSDLLSPFSIAHRLAFLSLTVEFVRGSASTFLSALLVRIFRIFPECFIFVLLFAERESHSDHISWQLLFHSSYTRPSFCLNFSLTD